LSLRLKLVVVILAVGLVPLGISAWTTLSLHQRAFEARTAELHRKAAEYGAASLEGYLEGTSGSLSQAVRAIDWPSLSDEERTGALRLIFKQVDPLAAVALLDERGQGIGSSAYLTLDSPPDPQYARHPRASLQLLSELAARIPFDEGRGAFAFGELFDSPGMAAPLLPIAVPVEGPKKLRWVLAAALSLQPLCAAISRVGASGASAYLVDPGGRAVCRAGEEGRLGTVDPALLRSRGPGEQLLELQGPKGELRIAAVAGTAAGWRAVVEQPAEVAYASNARMRNETLGWLALSLAVALASGLLLSRRILRPVRQLLEGAGLLAQGQFHHRLAVESADELGQLSGAFNHMGQEIEARDKEIRAFNEELQQRVDQRTRELRDAQEQLLHSQKMAAITGLGAGFAHEINNPLTAVIGLSQVMLNRLQARDPGGGTEDQKVLEALEEEAHRIRRVVRTLLSLSQNPGGDGFADLDVRELVDGAIQLVQEKLAEAQIEVVRCYQQGVPRVRGNSAQLRQVLLDLFNNSRAAMSGTGGRLTVATSSIAQGAVRIEVSDTGRGISPEHLPKIFDPFFTTKDEWRSEGLGLTVASRVVENHKGRIQAQSEVGKGTTLTITLPAAPSGAHLA